MDNLENETFCKITKTEDSVQILGRETKVRRTIEDLEIFLWEKGKKI